jgi:hypothetical protein
MTSFVFRCQLLAIRKKILARTFLIRGTIHKASEPFMADVRVCLKSEEESISSGDDFARNFRTTISRVTQYWGVY